MIANNHEAESTLSPDGDCIRSQAGVGGCQRGLLGESGRREGHTAPGPGRQQPGEREALWRGLARMLRVLLSALTGVSRSGK